MDSSVRSPIPSTSEYQAIRNALHALCSEALAFRAHTIITIHFDRILPSVISQEKQRILKAVLEWYRRTHPIRFGWLDWKD